MSAHSRGAGTSYVNGWSTPPSIVTSRSSSPVKVGTTAAAAAAAAASTSSSSWSSSGIAYTSSANTPHHKHHDSRTASPIQVLPTTSTTTHPLRLPPTPKLDSSFSTTTFASSTMFNHQYNNTSSLPSSGTSTPNPNQNSSVRSRKPHSPDPSISSNIDLYFTVDSDVTRPSLRRLTAETTSRVGSPAMTGYDSVRTSFDEATRSSKRATSTEERDVVVHKVRLDPSCGLPELRIVDLSVVYNGAQLIKTDTLASICLKYGITAQALRSSNRLWPSDSIHLRSSLNIPLDQCHLSSSSSGIVRIVREEDGNLVLWEKDSISTAPNRPIPSTSTLTMNPETSSLSSSSSEIVSPRAKRVVNTPEFGENESASSSTADLINIWNSTPEIETRDNDDARTISSRSYLNGHRRNESHPSLTNGNDSTKGKGRAFEGDFGSNYLSTTHNPYSDPPLKGDQLIAFTPPIPGSSSSNGMTEEMDAGLSKRTLMIERVGKDQLSFFPEPSATNLSSTNTETITNSVPTTSSYQSNQKNGNGHQRNSSLFGPLVNSLAKLTTSSTEVLFGSSESLMHKHPSSGMGSAGMIRLTSSSNGLPTLNNYRSNQSSVDSGMGAGAGTEKNTSSWLSKRWDPTYFGDEQEYEPSRSSSTLGGHVNEAIGKTSKGGKRREYRD